MQTHQEVLEYYQQLLSDQEITLKRCSDRWSMMSYLRGGTFLVSLLPLLLALNQVWGYSSAWVVLSGLIFLTFLVIAYVHEGMQSQLTKAKLLSTMHQESIARCKRDWPAIKVPQVDVPKNFIANSTDLDLLGDTSIYKLLGTTRTPLGTDLLTDWIIDGAKPAEIKLRQEAVVELKPKYDWRLKFRILCEQLAAGRSGPSRFVEWSESPNWFDNRSWILWLSRLTSLANIVMIGLLLFGVLPLTIVGPALMITVPINFFLSVFYAGAMHDIFNQISSRADEANHYVALFNMVGEFPAESEKLKTLQVRLLDKEHDAQQSIQKLGRLVWLANIRRQGVGFIIYLIFEFLFFWDAHCLGLLEDWKKNYGEYVRGWFEDLAEWEALCALGKLAGDEPDWNFPVVTENPEPAKAIVKGLQVGHPLLDTKRVPNDVQIGPAGTVLLVTGSNMSGKSTLLRSVGANIVLAQMGSVVCAKELSLPPIHIETSMRIVDSLADGVSFFMAELNRLKSIVDSARVLSAEKEKTMMFLLDEILQGTNSRERQIAVSRVVRKLIDSGAIGAISTHDLDLATTDDLEKACKTVHFSEHFEDVDGERKMTFDYRMKPGIAETTNALKLLEMVGLGEKN